MNKLMESDVVVLGSAIGWVKTTDSRHRFPRYLDLIKGMVINRLNQVWL